MFSRQSVALVLAAATLIFSGQAKSQVIIDIGGGNSRAEALNFDGSVVVGTLDLPNSGVMPIRWTPSLGLQNMSCGHYGTLSAVDAVGIYPAGANTGGSPAYTAARWSTGTPTGNWACFATLGAQAGQSYSSAYGISGDGSLVVGAATFFNPFIGDYTRPWLWTQGTGILALPIPLIYGAAGVARGVSSNGQIIVGDAGSKDFLGYFAAAAYWDGAGHHSMGVMTPQSGGSRATAVNADGSVIVGYGDLAVQGFPFPTVGPWHAFRWTQPGGFQDLGLLSSAPANGYTIAKAVSADGTVVVGEGTDASGVRAFIWREDFGMIRLDVLLAYLNVDTTGWVLNTCNGISGDARALCGTGMHNGIQRGFVIRNLPALCGPLVTFTSSNMTVCRGENVCLFTTGFFPGFLRPQMQWRKLIVAGELEYMQPISEGETGSGSYVTGTTSDNLCFYNAQPSDSGYYDCVISAGCATVVTGLMTLTVHTPPTMLMPVQLSQTACSHGTATFFVSVIPGSAGGPLTYQWNKDNVPISDGVSCGSTIVGSNAATLTLTNCAGVDAGVYGVTVSGTCGPLISAGQLSVCVADVDDGSATGTCDGGVTLDDLLYYLGLFDGGYPAADIDDGSSTGLPDCGLTLDDLLYYLARFDAGC